MLKTIGRSKLVLGTAGFLLAAYLKFVWATTRFSTDPQPGTDGGGCEKSPRRTYTDSSW